MKKLLTSLLALFLIVTPVYGYYSYSDTNLYQFYGGNLPSISERAETYRLVNSEVYIGTAKQNNLFLEFLKYSGLEEEEEDLKMGADTQKFFGGFTYRIAGSGITASASSITLTKLTLPQNDYPIQDSDLSDTFYITLEPGNKTRQEFASCTTVGANTGGNVTLSGCTRGLSPIAPYTASTTLRFSHSGASAVIFSNSPNLYDQAAFKGNDETITGTWLVPIPTEATQVTNKTYVDNVALQGAATSSESQAGIISQATAIETASSTAFAANNPHAINSEMATSTPGNNATLQAVISENDGKLSQNWYDFSEAWTFTGQVNLDAPTTTISSATTTFDGTTSYVAIGTTTSDMLASGLAVDDDVYISGGLAIGTNATTSNGNLVVSGLASTTNLLISNSCDGCSMTYTASSTNFNVSSGSVTFTGSIPALANNVLIDYRIDDPTGGDLSTRTNIIIARVGLTTQAVQNQSADGSYIATFTWSGNNFTVEESTDVNTNGNVAGTAYWYK